MKLQALLVLCGFLGMPFVGAQTILLPGAPENTERKAAEELAEHFSKMTGGSIAIGKDPRFMSAIRHLQGNRELISAASAKRSG